MQKQIFIFCLLFLSLQSKAQLAPGIYSSTNKKAISAFEDAVKYFQQNNDARAEEAAQKAIAKDSNFIESFLLLAEIYNAQDKIQKSIEQYTKAIYINPKFNLSSFYNRGMLEIKIGKYEEAKKDFISFLKKPNIIPDSKDIAERNIDNCNFAIEAMNHPVAFVPVNLGESINSNLSEYFPSTTADDQIFLYTRNDRTETNPLQEDFLISQKVNGLWSKSKLVEGINTPGNEGAPAVSADGQLLFFVACAEMDNNYGPNRKGFGGCDIFYSEKIGNYWAKTYNLGPTINSNKFESQPSFSSDGKTLYFVSNRACGLGDVDIWCSTLREDNSWGAPVNLGNKINTPGKEESVFIHPDNKTLYFSSNGHVGMGGLDIYIVRKNENGEWGTPVNLGYPINTFGDENSLLVNGAGNLAYFASDRPGGFGGLDMYQFELYEGARPDKITYMKGKVYDAKTKQPLGAHFELIDLTTSLIVNSSDANSGNGEFLVTLPIDKNYALNVSQKGYLFYSENFSLKNLKDFSKPYLMDVPLQPIDTGNVVELKNIFFETAKFDLKPESKIELNKLIAFLNSNKAVRIELSGHTDDVGENKMNLTLSNNRAKSVYEFLILNGMDAKRLTYKGYGETKPKVKNDSDEHRAMNRRTEFKVIGK